MLLISFTHPTFCVEAAEGGEEEDEEDFDGVGKSNTKGK